MCENFITAGQIWLDKDLEIKVYGRELYNMCSFSLTITFPNVCVCVINGHRSSLLILASQQPLQLYLDEVMVIEHSLQVIMLQGTLENE